MRQLVERHPQDQDRENAERDRHRIGPQDIGGRQHHELMMGVRQMRCEQASARACDLGRDHWQEPHRGHAVERMFVPGKHEVGDRYTAGERHRDVDPPQCLGDRDHAGAEPRQAERQEPVDDRREAHRDRTDEHRYGVVPEDPPRLVPEHRPARGVEPGEQREERDVEIPQCLADRVQRRADARHLR